MDIDFAAILAYAIGLLLLYVVGRILIMPLRILIRLIYNGIVGGIVLLLINYLGAFIGISVAINPVTALTVGFLGIPGVMMLIILKYVLG